jgi:hypothetical protein
MKRIPSFRDKADSTAHLDLGLGNLYSGEKEHLFEMGSKEHAGGKGHHIRCCMNYRSCHGTRHYHRIAYQIVDLARDIVGPFRALVVSLATFLDHPGMNGDQSWSVGREEISSVDRSLRNLGSGEHIAEARERC